MVYDCYRHIVHFRVVDGSALVLICCVLLCGRLLRLNIPGLLIVFLLDPGGHKRDVALIFRELFCISSPIGLDLLLYLIRRQNLDILDIDVAEITKQYMGYIELMASIQLELAAEYLVMAAMLAEIKSRMLLPRQQSEDEDEEDPRAELIKRLQEYERFKKAAEDIDELPRMGRDIHRATADSPDRDQQRPHPDVDMRELA